jgi:hypothetical protein
MIADNRIATYGRRATDEEKRIQESAFWHNKLLDAFCFGKRVRIC